MLEITYGMVGGGPGAMIGPAHRKAVQLDGMFFQNSGNIERVWS